MLRLFIEGEEFFNEKDQTFHTVGDFELELEHSLVSLSKWESKYKKPFLSKDPKTPLETIDYMEFMITSPNPPPDAIRQMSHKNLSQIDAYIQSSESATTFGDMPKTGGRGETITSELIYYWMVAFNIPFECERWHLNRLFALIRICNLKQQKPKKMSRSELAARNRTLNEKRRAELNTRG